MSTQDRIGHGGPIVATDTRRDIDTELATKYEALSPAARRVYDVLQKDDALAFPRQIPATADDATLSSFELDCLDWGIVLGMAFEIVRGDRDDLDVRSEAQRVAEEVWRAWSDDRLFTSVAFLEDRLDRSAADWRERQL